MPRGAPGGGSSRGRGRGGSRHKGAHKHYTNPDQLQEQEAKEQNAQAWRRQKGIESDESGEEEGANAANEKKTKKPPRVVQPGDLPPSSSEEESESEEEGKQKPKGVQSIIGHEVYNPNYVHKEHKKVSDMGADAKPQLSRREREELDKQRAAENYRKMHEAGLTEEAQSDMARLRMVRERREAAAKKKEEERKAEEAAKQS